MHTGMNPGAHEGCVHVRIRQILQLKPTTVPYVGSASDMGLLFIYNGLHVNANLKSTSIRNNILMHINKAVVSLKLSLVYL